MKIIRWAVAPAAVVGALALAAPAYAQDVPYEAYQTNGCELTILAANPTAHTTYLVVDVEGDVEVVELAPGGDGQAGPYQLDEVVVQYRLFGGPERDYDSPQWEVERADLLDYLDEHGDAWVTGGTADTPAFVLWRVAEVEGCEPAEPTTEPTAQPTTEPTVEPTTEPTSDASEGPAPGEAGGLPVTGSPAGWYAGLGIGGVLAGAGLIGLARRRRAVGSQA